MSLFEKKKLPLNFIIVKEGITGIETYVDDNLSNMHPSYKAQIISFLQTTIDILNEENSKIPDYSAIMSKKVLGEEKPKKKGGLKIQFGGD